MAAAEEHPPGRRVIVPGEASSCRRFPGRQPAVGACISAELDLQILANPITLLVGVIYIIARSAGKYFGAYGSCKLTKCNEAITKNLGITLLPQAGVALGMAMTATALSDGAIVRNVVLFSVLVYELVGPALTRMSLLKAGAAAPVAAPAEEAAVEAAPAVEAAE